MFYYGLHVYNIRHKKRRLKTNLTNTKYVISHLEPKNYKDISTDSWPFEFRRNFIENSDYKIVWEINMYLLINVNVVFLEVVNSIVYYKASIQFLRVGGLGNVAGVMIREIPLFFFK